MPAGALCPATFSGVPWGGGFRPSRPAASICTCASHARSRKYIRRKAWATVAPTVSVPWLRRIMTCLAPRSSTSRSRSSSSVAMPS